MVSISNRVPSASVPGARTVAGNPQTQVAAEQASRSAVDLSHDALEFPELNTTGPERVGATTQRDAARVFQEIERINKRCPGGHWFKAAIPSNSPIVDRPGRWLRKLLVYRSDENWGKTEISLEEAARRYAAGERIYLVPMKGPMHSPGGTPASERDHALSKSNYRAFYPEYFAVNIPNDDTEVKPGQLEAWSRKFLAAHEQAGRSAEDEAFYRDSNLCQEANGYPPTYAVYGSVGGKKVRLGTPAELETRGLLPEHQGAKLVLWKDMDPQNKWGGWEELAKKCPGQACDYPPAQFVIDLAKSKRPGSPILGEE